MHSLLPFFSFATFCLTWQRSKGKGFFGDNKPHLIVTAATLASPMNKASSDLNVTSLLDESMEMSKEKIKSIFDRFETHGPIITLTLQDPLKSLLVGPINHAVPDFRVGRPNRKVLALGSVVRKVAANPSSNSLSTRLATFFKVGLPTSSPSILTSQASSKANSYMLNNGDIVLDSASIPENDSSMRTSFPKLTHLRRTSLSECIQSVNPEISYEIKTLEPQPMHGENLDNVDVRPFPCMLPWLSALSCRMAWCPFQADVPSVLNDYHCKFLSVPYFVQCSATISRTCIKSIFSPWRYNKRENLSHGNNPGGYQRKQEDIRVALTYRDKINCESGRLELLLGRPNSVLCAGTNNQNSNQSHNYIFVRLAKGMQKENLIEKFPSYPSLIEYIKGSFRLPLSGLLRSNGSNEVYISPSYDFEEGKARCVVFSDVGSSGRTKAILRLDADDSTLTLARYFDERKVIAPTISLQSGKIVYDWYFCLKNLCSGQASNFRDSESFIRAHVDPMRGIQIVWTDFIKNRPRGSCWITELKVPLGTTPPRRYADIRVGRKWTI